MSGLTAVVVELDPRRPEVTVGRDASCDVSVDDTRVSRRHVVIRRDGDGWVLEDQRSKNGVFVDGERVRRVTITEPTTVLLGDPSDGVVLDVRPPAPVALTVVRPQPATTRIGRAPDNDVVVDDLLASRHHAELRRTPDGLELVDLNSHNGTFVNGRRTARARLADLDVVGIGHHLFRLVDGVLEEHVDTGEVSFEASDLTVRSAKGDVLLDHVGFSLPERALLGVVGPSGAGKTTLLRAITGFRPADEGVVVYDGRDLYSEYDELRRRIGFVPQDDVVHPELTVRQAIEFAAELRFPPDVDAETRLRRVDEVIGELGLAPRRDAVIGKLSGGQRKRVSVALELLTRPSLLFLDEPTSGLDPGYERNLMQMLRELADGGRTVIVVTHSVASLFLCDRVLVLATGGRMAYFGPPQLATAHFGRDDFQEVFQDLSEHPERDWPALYAASPDHEQYLVRPATSLPGRGRVHHDPPAPPRQADSWRQFRTLSRRYLFVLLGDKRNVVLLGLQAPAIALVMLVTLPHQELKLPANGSLRILSRAAPVLFQLITTATWLGLSNAITAIVKERPIFHRERAVGLSAWAYLGSKAFVLSIFTIFQCAVLVWMATLPQGGPQHATVLGWPLGELIVAVSITGLAAMGLGLLVSAAVRSVDMAMAILPVLLVLQNVLAMGGTFPEVVRKPVLQQLSYVAGSQYGFAAAASTADLNRLQAISNVVREIGSLDLKDTTKPLPKVDERDVREKRYAHTSRVWWANILALVGLTFGGLIGAGMVLDRRARERS